MKVVHRKQIGVIGHVDYCNSTLTAAIKSAKLDQNCRVKNVTVNKAVEKQNSTKITTPSLFSESDIKLLNNYPSYKSKYHK